MESTMSSFSGMIDEAGIWTRALSDAEIDSLYKPAMIGIDEFSKPSFSLYPNPASEKVRVVLNNQHHGQVNLHVMNALSQTVYSEQLKSSIHELVIDQLPRGFYFVKIETNSGTSFSRKLIIQ